MANKKLLVAGARGIVGRSTINHFRKLKAWDVVGLSRSASDFDSEIQWINVDLQNSEDCRNKLQSLDDVSHICYSAVFEKENLTSGWAQSDHAEINLNMLRNLIENLDKNSPKLQHITLMQGTKAYGGHLGPFKMPAREQTRAQWVQTFIMIRWIGFPSFRNKTMELDDPPSSTCFWGGG